jgi:hypothetical protein
MLPPSIRFPPLREGNHVGVWFPRLARGTVRGFGSRAWRGEPERLGSPCGQGEPQGGGSKNSASHAPRLTVRALCTEVRAPRLTVRALCTEVRAPCTEVRAPCTEVRAPCTEVRAPRLTVRALCTEVRAPCTAVHRCGWHPDGLHGMSPHSGWNSKRLMMTSTSRPLVGGSPFSSHRFMRGVSSPDGGTKPPV